MRSRRNRGVASDIAKKATRPTLARLQGTATADAPPILDATDWPHGHPPSSLQFVVRLGPDHFHDVRQLKA
jgi:hypothetical protein